jgi:hypothetical protein
MPLLSSLDLPNEKKIDYPRGKENAYKRKEGG